MRSNKNYRGREWICVWEAVQNWYCFQVNTARLTLNGIKLHSKPRSRKDFRGTALCLGAVRDADVHMCVHTHRHGFSSPCARIYPFPVHSAGQCEHCQLCHPTLICCHCHSPGSCSA